MKTPERSKHSLRREKIRQSVETDVFRREVLEFSKFCERGNHPEVADSVKRDLSTMTHMPFYGIKMGRRRYQVAKIDMAVLYVTCLNEYGKLEFSRELLKRIIVQQNQLLRKLAPKNDADKKLAVGNKDVKHVWDHAVPSKVVRDEIIILLVKRDINKVRKLFERYVKGGQRWLTTEEDMKLTQQKYKDSMPSDWRWEDADCDVLVRYKKVKILRFVVE